MNDDTNRYWLNRRTIRKYDARDVNPDLVESLIEKASHAPTTGNMQLYSVVITTDNKIKERLAPCHFNQPQVMGAPLILTFCADFNRMTRWAEERGAIPGFSNFQSFMAATLDAVAFAQQFNTIAEMSGLGCCWLGTTTYNAAEIAKILELPKLVVPVITLAVGYPANDGEDVGRLPVNAVVHHQQYGDYGRAAIDVFYAEKESREDSEKFIAENGKDSLAAVFTDVRYPRENNEIFSDKFLQFLKSAGFLP